MFIHREQNGINLLIQKERKWKQQNVRSGNYQKNLALLQTKSKKYRNSGNEVGTVIKEAKNKENQNRKDSSKIKQCLT